MTDPNAEYKVRPVVSTDCEAGDHLQCEGEESALWPDGSSTMRPCSCPCHALVFAAAGPDVKQGIRTIARAVSANMALRIANALNKYKPGSRGY